MRFIFPAPVPDDDHDSCDEKARSTARAAASSSHTANADPHQAEPGQPRPPTTACTLARGCSTSTPSAPAMAESASSSTSSAHPGSCCKQRDEADAARADLLARLQRCSVTDADWDNATSSSSSSDDEPEDKDDKDLSSSHKGTTDHAARLTNQQGSVEASQDAATNNTSTGHVAFNSATSRQQQQQPRPPGAGGRGHSLNQAFGRRKSGPLQPSRRRAGDSWVLLGRGEARPLGPGAPGLTVTRPDGAVFALRPPGNRDGGDDALVMRRKTS
ncbi:hypothetical protein MAPG_06667 [Magnaporthiopsis poae ATCC 64411]|uniref:Uncharacterized protein n=1 Tax=Magnaporthiopsis poae (strain ATCC 64411 / 73-15) TaxID=644358 RepID=A0A0C4E2M7_MAGP6|nr:hypothetical protein MAPG_06667 [Magnaporthiopsis poae ATCC 64411]